MFKYHTYYSKHVLVTDDDDDDDDKCVLPGLLDLFTSISAQQAKSVCVCVCSLDGFDLLGWV